MINTRDFTITSENKRPKKYKVSSLKDNKEVQIVNKTFEKAMNTCKAVIMKKHELIIKV